MTISLILFVRVGLAGGGGGFRIPLVGGFGRRLAGVSEWCMPADESDEGGGIDVERGGSSLSIFGCSARSAAGELAVLSSEVGAAIVSSGSPFTTGGELGSSFTLETDIWGSSSFRGVSKLPSASSMMRILGIDTENHLSATQD